MRNRNRLPALLLALVMALGLTGTALAAENDETGYTDVPAWAQEYVEAVTEAGLIDGKTAETFAPTLRHQAGGPGAPGGHHHGGAEHPWHRQGQRL